MEISTPEKLSIPIKTLIPGLVGVTILTLGRRTKKTFLETQSLDSNILNHPSNIPESGSKSLLVSVAEGLEKTIFEGSDNYLSFLMIILLINFFLHGFDMIRSQSTKREKQNDTTFVSHWKHATKRIRQILISLFIGSLLWISMGSKISEQPTLKNIQTLLPSRMLEEYSPSSSLQEYKKPSLSIGKILGQVDIYAVSIQVSRDGKTAFVITNFPSMLKIIDVSDPESPAIQSSLSLSIGGSSNMLSKGLIVSQDETELYVSSFEYLLIIEISNLKSPFILGSIQDKASITAVRDERFEGFAKPNFLLSRDNRFLFVSEYGLQIFDISVPTAPILIRSLRSRIGSDRLVIPSSIAFSTDKKTLFYSDGGLWVYDVSDPRDIRVMSSFNTTYMISSMRVSDDAKTAFVLGLDQESKILLQNLDISDISSIKESQVMQFNRTSDCLPVFLERTPGNLFLLILYDNEARGINHELLIFDTFEQHLLQHEKLFIKKDALSVAFSEDYRRVLAGNFGRLEIADLYLDYPNKHAFTASSNAIKRYTVPYNFFSTSGNEMIYSMTNDGFRIDKIGLDNKLRSLSTIKAQGKIINMVTSKDHKKAFLMEEEGKVEILDISNLQNITVLGEYVLKSKFGQPKIYSSASSPDGKILYLAYSAFLSNYLLILDISDPKKVTQLGSIEQIEIATFVTPLLSNDGRTLFVISHSLFIYDVSRPSDPELLIRYSFVNEDHVSVRRPSIFGTLAADGKALFVRDESSESDAVIYVIDVSNVTNPRTKSEFRFSNPAPDWLFAEKAILGSADSKRIYIARPSSLMVVDVSNLSDPKYLGSIKFGGNLKDFSLSDDGRKAFVLTKDGKFITVSIEPKYTTIMMQDNLMLGERYSINVQAIKMNEYLDYDQMEVDYRFTQFALVESKSMQNADFEEASLKMPPSWMSFDLRSQTLSVEARRKNDIKTYRVYFGFSTKIPQDAFSDLKIGNQTVTYQDIFSTLVALAYIDNQFFLTENFGLYEDFILPSLYDPIERKIYEILQGYSFGTYNELKIIESLNITADEDNKLKISTASGVNLKIEINLDGEAQFLHRPYGFLLPAINNNKYRLIMEGSLKDVNSALQEVVINLPNEKSCDGRIVIDDKLNPILNQSIKNISKHFNHNQPPKWNKDFILTVQDQVDKESVLTGQYFQIKLNQKTFLDLYTEVDNLNYQLVYMKDDNETTVLPTWVSFSDLTLMGTAPEELFNRDFEFKLIVKNEFQEYKESLALHVGISSSFVIKLLVKYSPYILSFVGLLISANKIYNVVCKGSYKHSKDFYVNVGEEINSEVIFPIGFIREENEEAKKILVLIEKKVGGRNKKQLLDYFMNNGRERNLDKLKVIETIKESLKKLSREEKKNFVLYLGGSQPERIINQIIINTLTDCMLNEDKETKGYFEKMKENWSEFVEWNLVNSCFKINDNKFNSFLRKSSNDSTLTNDDSLLLSSTSSLSQSFIQKSNINIDLLKDSILAYAFECQNIDILPGLVQINVKEKIKTNFLKQFLRLDLQDCPLREKSKIGYGIECFREYHTMFFNGVARPDIANVVIVVQITNLQHRILKEFWIFGGRNEDEEGFGVERGEKDARGKEYEIF